MSNLYTINVTNNSASNQEFFIFQHPAIYMGGPKVYSNSLYQELVAPYVNGGVMQFQMDLQFYAGVQTVSSLPAVGQVSGGTTASQPVNLTSATGAPTNNATTFSINPLSLSAPTAMDGVQPGAFRITAPIYTPASDGNFNVGMASQGIQQGAPAILSNFIVAQPNQFVDCQPVLKFYVATGSYSAGQVINFTTASNVSALCDATGGASTFYVSYNPDGTWTVKS